MSVSRALNVLVIDEWIPYPPADGKRVRTWNLLRRLAARHNISLLCYGNSEALLAAVQSTGIRLYTVAPLTGTGGWQLYLRLAANVFSTHPYSATKHHTRRFAERLKRLLHEEHFDLLHCEWTPYASYLAAANGLPKFMMAHNIESQVWFRRAQQGHFAFERTFFSLQARRMEAFEREAARSVDGVGAVTVLDAEQFRAWGARCVSLIENGVDLDRFKPAEDKPRSGRILFLASLDWYPNQDALDYFLRRIMHLICQRFPTAKLQVVGKAPSLALKKRLMQCAGVELVGEVNDVRPYLAQAVVVVVPLRIGGGSRIKILEALAMGKPVVSTSIGAEGLALSGGVHIALADTPTEFAARTVELLRSHDECQRLGENGRRLVIERYSWDRAANNLDSAWQKVCRPYGDSQTAKSQKDQLELPLTVNGQL